MSSSEHLVAQSQNQALPLVLPFEKDSRDRDGEVFKYLKQSKYPGIPDDPINLLISYCRAARLDPLSEVAHIVPYNTKDKDTNQWRKSYQILPGIAKFRIQGARTGKCMGVSEPEFGPIVKEKVGSIMMEYPEWCIVKIKMLVDGNVAEYVAKEYWKENYASKKRDDATPNEMWQKRPRGQLAKCAEAQGWRKACPELFGGQPTFEEMHGKYFSLDEEFSKSEERSSDVVQRVKSMNRTIEKKEVGSLGVVEIQTFENGEIEDQEITKPVKEVNVDLLNLFNLLKDSKPAVTERINDFILKRGFDIGKADDRMLSYLIKKTVLVFPELIHQLSQDQKDIVEKIAKE